MSIDNMNLTKENHEKLNSGTGDIIGKLNFIKIFDLQKINPKDVHLYLFDPDENKITL